MPCPRAGQLKPGRLPAPVEGPTPQPGDDGTVRYLLWAGEEDASGLLAGAARAVLDSGAELRDLRLARTHSRGHFPLSHRKGPARATAPAPAAADRTAAAASLAALLQAGRGTIVNITSTAALDCAHPAHQDQRDRPRDRPSRARS